MALVIRAKTVGLYRHAGGGDFRSVPRAILLSFLAWRRAYGDSQTEGRALETEASSHWVAFNKIWDDTIAGSNAPGFIPYAAAPAFGSGGRSLQGHWDEFTSHLPLTDGPYWVHFQESGNQAPSGQTTPEEFYATLIAFVLDIYDQLTDPIVTTESAFSFGREATPGRNWDPHNVMLYKAAAYLTSIGKPLYVTPVDDAIKALQTSSGITPGDVWYQTGQLNEYHYTGLGNIQIALAMYKLAGVRMSDLVLDFTETGAITAARVAQCAAIAEAL